MNKLIRVSVVVNAEIEKVWKAWTNSEDIMKWNFASDDWECPRVENDLRVSGKFKARMQEKVSKEGFDFEGTYTEIKKNELIEYTMSGGDARKVKVEFKPVNGKVEVIESFEMELENSEEMQRGGWQAILNNFKRYVEVK